MEKLKLSNVTLVCVSNVKHDIQLKVIDHCMELVDFGEAIFITNINLKHNNNKIKIIQTDELSNISYPKDWSEFMIYKLKNFINTDFCLVVHNDGFIVNPESWTDEFLKYDYIGSPWQNNTFIDDNGEIIRVGNGGFSLRSKKLLNVFIDLNIPWEAYRDHWHDDGFISMAHLKELREYGILIPDAQLAYKFGREKNCDDLNNSIKPFGFHGYFEGTDSYVRFN